MNPKDDSVLQLSVHSVPPTRLPSAREIWRGRWKMLIVWAVCAAPVVASYLMYYVIKPEGRVNYGELITPTPMPADTAWSLQDLQGHTVLPSSLKGQWLLVVVAPSTCDAACERQLYLQRQLREMLGKDKDKLDRVWLVPDDGPVAPVLAAALQTPSHSGWVLRPRGEVWAQWLQPAPPREMREYFYLVDPRGDWMMRFPADGDPSRIKKDLMRLMRANDSWDEAGR